MLPQRWGAIICHPSLQPTSSDCHWYDRIEWPKVCRKTLSNGVRLVGIAAKGEGMMEPNMATMLSYIRTDATVIPKANFANIMSEIVNASFNSISSR